MKIQNIKRSSMLLAILLLVGALTATGMFLNKSVFAEENPVCEQVLSEDTTLAADLDCDNSVAFSLKIASSDVTLDCAGYQLGHSNDAYPTDAFVVIDGGENVISNITNMD
jgi:hypothetical protein